MVPLAIALGATLVAVPAATMLFLLTGRRIDGRRPDGRPAPKPIDVLARSQWFLKTDKPFLVWFCIYLLSSSWTVVSIWRNAGWEVWVSAAFLVASGVSWVFRWRAKAKAADALETVPNADRFEPLEYLAPYGPEKGWVPLHCTNVDTSDDGSPLRGGDLAITSPALNERLWREDDPIKIRRGGIWLPHAGPVASRRILMGGRHNCLNEPKIRLGSDLTATTEEVVLEETDYAAYVVTNNLALKEVLDEHDSPALSFKETCLHAGRIPPLALSKCSNHLGGDLLCIEPGVVRLQQQSSRAFVFADSWVASASGSFDADKDLKDGDDLVAVVKRGLIRELDEELVLKGINLPEPSDVKILGYARATYTAGKPQFFGVARSSGLRSLGKEAYSRRYYPAEFDPEGGIPAILSAVHGLKEREQRFSPALVLLLILIKEWAEADPKAYEWIRAGWKKPLLPASPPLQESANLRERSLGEAVQPTQ